MAEDKYVPGDERPRVGDGECGKCKRKLTRGHRVSVAHIVDREGNDMHNLSRKGLYLYEEFEFVHVDCHDPFLKKG